jgi:hypothetical protein
MRRPQFSLWWLLGLTALVAVACTALMNASDTWAMLLHSALLGLLLMGVLRAVYRHGPVRAFWIGFALFGWVYLILVYWVHYNSQFADEFNNPAGSQLATTRLLQQGYDHVLPLVRKPPANAGKGSGGFGAGGGSGGGFFGGGPAPNSDYPDQQTFMRVGQPLCALLLALVGGWIARGLEQSRGRHEPH